MFTGIVTDVGRVVAVERRGDSRFTIATRFDLATVPIGASIACSGVCLTVVATGDGTFSVDASAETLSKTTLAAWSEGSRVNLERALRMGDELGGHLVSGHIDGVADVVSRRADGDSQRFTFAVPAALARYVASKGSVALDGVSLTVNEVDGNKFGVNIIPHTLAETTFGTLNPGQKVNFEVDMLARYVARLIAGL
ncbi:MAG: riboflavin synthase [Azospirillaceae bacterium]|nr:riboflavin synthase [Azospirillaceae bacterium]